jgi:cation diffusion facilitator CzcD-associated flavoprotein CzcO
MSARVVDMSTNTEMKESNVDVLIIGAGPAGEMTLCV